MILIHTFRRKITILMNFLHKNSNQHQFQSKQLTSIDLLSRHVYNEGSSHVMRPAVWRYLLGYYPPGCTEHERVKINDKSAEEYWVVLEECNRIEKYLLEVCFVKVLYYCCNLNGFFSLILLMFEGIRVKINTAKNW